jgi:sucrose phosphorylase
MAKNNKKAFPGRKAFKTTETIHNPLPDYQRPLLKIPEKGRKKILKRMSFLYGDKTANAYMPEVERLMEVYYAHKPLKLIEKEKKFDPKERFTQEDIILITYGDLLQGNDCSPLLTLAKFCDSYLEGTINTLHILPFFPYSSDRGFSVTDFESVDPKLGTWEDIEDLENRYQLMFDGVINHVSSQSRWFQEFLNGNPYYWEFFISFNSSDELSPEERRLIFRPRTSRVLTEFQTINGSRYVWTTFSKDQIDLNYQNPDVLMRMLEILLLYVRHGMDIIRLDAVTYLWAEPGTRCVHLDQTHEIVKLFRDILNIVAPAVAIITETNVPHEENISYFGNGRDEAQMVYNFALPPLVLHTFYSQNATALSKWAQTLDSGSDFTTFFNFLDSHDGIGLMAVRDILKQEEIGFIIQRAQEHGGLISHKSDANGIDVPYEINITWFSALNKEESNEDIAFQVKRFVASRSIALVLQGVPGVYLHSLLGTRNDVESVLVSRSKRDINRTEIHVNSITDALQDSLSKISRISRELGRLLVLRTRRGAFHPNSDQKILIVSPDIFIVVRKKSEKKLAIAMTNVTDRTSLIEISLLDIGTTITHWFDIVSKVEWMADKGVLYLTLQPYDIVWLEPFREGEKA